MASTPDGVVYTFHILGTDNDLIGQESIDVYAELPNFIQKKHLYNEKLYSGWSVYNKATNKYDTLTVDSTSGEVVPSPDNINYLLGSGASQHIELRAQIVENFPLNLQYGLLDNIYNTQDGTLRSAYALAPGSLRLGYNNNRAMLFWDSGTKRMPVSAEIKWSDILGVPEAAVMALTGATGNLAVTRADGKTENIPLPYLPYTVANGVSTVVIPLTFTDFVTLDKKLTAKSADFDGNISTKNITADGTLTIKDVFTPQKVENSSDLDYVFGINSKGTGVMVKRALTDLTVGNATNAGHAATAGSASTAGHASTADALKTARTISIASLASDGTAPTFNGSGDITLLIPKTLSGFTSITADSFTGNLTGKATSAGSADEATNAGYAASAGSAVSANTAGSADTATKLTTARAFAISGSASDGTAPTFDGTAGITLLIPKTLTNFTSITSTKFVGDLEGNATSATTAGSAGYATSAGSATTADTAGKLHSIGVVFTPANAALTPDKLYADFLGGNCFSARRGSWDYAGNGYIAKGSTAATQCPFGAIDLAGASILQWAVTNTHYTQLYITAPTANTTDAIKGEMIYFINNGSGYSPTWYRVLTDKNFNTYAPKKDGTGASGTWGINISGNAATATTASNAGYATSAGSASTATKANLLNLSHGSVHGGSSTETSSWNGQRSELAFVWGQRWMNSSATGNNDSGDLVLGLRPGIYVPNSTELCMCIDGDYYSMGNVVLHAANYHAYSSFSGTVKSTYSGPAFLAETAAGAWAYLRLNSGGTLWDIATRSDLLGGSLQFRVQGADTCCYIDRSANFISYGYVGVGNNKVRMSYNASKECLDFVFA